MKKILPLLFIATIATASSAAGQSLSVGVRGGLSIPNLTTSTDNPTSNGYSSRLGADAAIFANIRFSDLFSIQPMLEYSQQGGKNDFPAFPVNDLVDGLKDQIPDGVSPEQIKQILGGKDYIYIDSDSKAKINYLMLPVLAKFGWDFAQKANGNHFRVYAGAGPFVGYLLSAHQEYSNTQSTIYASRDKDDPLKVGGQPVDELIKQFLPDADLASNINGEQDIHSDIKNWNVGVSGNLGFSYHFARSSVFIEGGGNYGFVQIQEDTKNGKNHTGAATVDVGYSYQF